MMDSQLRMVATSQQRHSLGAVCVAQAVAASLGGLSVCVNDGHALHLNCFRAAQLAAKRLNDGGAIAGAGNLVKFFAGNPVLGMRQRSQGAGFTRA